MTKNIKTFLFLLFAVQIYCADAMAQTMIFKNGFEGNTAIKVRSNIQFADIRGNESVSKSDWLVDLENNVNIGGGQFYFEQGTSDLRSAEIVPDLINPANKVLRMRIKNQHILIPKTGERKCRIQYEMNNHNMPPAGGYMKEYYQKCQLFFSKDFEVLEKYPGNDIGWIIMQEFWNDPQFNAPDRDHRSEARVGIEIVKKNGKLHFGAMGRDPIMEVPNASNNSWEEFNYNFDIPFGKWMTQEIYIKEGGSAGTSNPGRFYMSITINNIKTVIVDKIGMTTSESVGYVPDGQTSFSPLKMYTVGKVGKTFYDNNKNMDVYWDNLEIWMNRKPEQVVLNTNEFDGSDEKVKVYPNPANDYVMFDGVQGNSLIELYTTLGQKVLSKIVTTDKLKISMLHLNSGIYFFKIIASGVIIQSGKIIKK